MTRYTWHVLCNDTLDRYSINTNIRNAIYFVDIPRYSPEIVSSYLHCRQIFFRMKMRKGFANISQNPSTHPNFLQKKYSFNRFAREKEEDSSWNFLRSSIVRSSRVSLVFFSRELRETTKRDIAYSSERSNATVERSKWRGNGRGKKAKRCSFPCFAFSPSPFRFFRFSVSLMKPLNTSSKRISFLGRSHFHLEPRGERKLPRTPLFRATKRYRADETGLSLATTLPI